MNIQSGKSYSRLSDPSLWGIVFGNLLSVYLAFSQGWELSQIMWIYWGQSVAIGVINVVRMLRLKEFSTEGMKSNGQPVPETMAAKRGIAMFFAFHYGFFHFIYAIFLWEQQPLLALEATEALLMMLGVSAFIGGHSFSFRHNMAADFREKKPKLGTLMFYPYMRIIPMHMTILFGGMIQGVGVVIFMVLKMLADAGMHMVEHSLFQRKD